ncbi:MerR family transcriptional regulator [Actinomyces sp.]|uniref:transcriptional regulator FtsR n=1 Tax=Actinomyces sp. TaxID=29317 RepID=UPI0026DADAF0|nr:MerR family transcriptional regulator [Actinomyces sp.]MDO4901562.1 MerR family transcriptional regulator [Actinomyces sp.]
MKIGEVVERLKGEFPALSVSKVRYLEAEGLISPHRVGNGYRRYSTADLERLRYTLTAQRDEYLPLSVIRERLSELDAQVDAPPPAPVARVVASGGRTVSGALDAEDLVHHSEATLEQIEELVAVGVIAPDAHGRFDSRALTTVALALKADRLGIPLRNLRAVRSAAEREADAIDLATRHKRNRSTTAGEDAAAELAAVLADLHVSLLHRAVEALG